MSGTRLLEIGDLIVDYATPNGPLRAVNGVSLQVDQGETLALVGELGSGKSTIAAAIVDLLRNEAATITGRLVFKGRDIVAASAEQRRALNGKHIGIVFQDPFTSLNPSLTIGRQVAEPLIQHMGLSSGDAMQRAVAALAEVGLPDPNSLVRAFPHQLSGGMQQRVLIATALVCNPELLILDEPTTALDVTVEAQILDLLDRLRRQRQLGMIYITHNLGVVSRIADRVCVLYAGQVFEIGAKSQILGSSRASLYQGTAGFLAAPRGHRSRGQTVSHSGRVSRPHQADAGMYLCRPMPLCRGTLPDRSPRDCRGPRWAPPALLEGLGPGRDALAQHQAGWSIERRLGGIRGSSRAARRRPDQDLLRARPGGGIEWTRAWGGLPWLRWRRRPLRAVDDVSLTIGRGEVLGLVGESGSGKTTLGRMMVRLIEPTRGKLSFGGEDVTALSAGNLRRFRKMTQLVFQNPDSSLNPRRSIGDAIARAVEIHSDLTAKARRARVEALLDMVGLPRRYYDRYPHQLSGGEKQRAGIARALATEPAFIVCDEPVSALDVSVQATILNLLKDLRDQLGIAYLFISHDLSVVAHVADRIAIMYAGRICEEGSAGAVLRPPHHPYTEALLSAVPFVEPSEGRQARIALNSDANAMLRPAQGCVFANRCHRTLGAICNEHTPPSRETADGHRILCHIPLADLEKTAVIGADRAHPIPSPEQGATHEDAADSSSQARPPEHALLQGRNRPRQARR